MHCAHDAATIRAISVCIIVSSLTSISIFEDNHKAIEVSDISPIRQVSYQHYTFFSFLLTYSSHIIKLTQVGVKGYAKVSIV